MKKLALLFIVIISLSSCVTIHNGNVSSSSFGLSEDVRIVDVAYGVSSYYTIFGMSGHRKDAMILDAKRNMYESYPLQPGQAYANFSVDIKTTLFLIGRGVKVIVSADIIAKGTNNSYNGVSISEKLRSMYGLGGLKPGDKILFSAAGYLTQEATVLKVKRNGVVRIGVINVEGNYQAKNIQKLDAEKFRSRYLQKQGQYSNGSGVEKDEAFVEKPLNLKAPDDAKGEIVTFKYGGKTWQGELLKEVYNGYMIRVTDQYETTKSIIISKSDLIKKD
jgi:hypothetical protein